MADRIRALGYVRVSTEEQQTSGLGLAAQRKAIRAECERRNWELVEAVGEAKGASAQTLDRAGLQSVLARMAAHEAEVLIVSKLDRLSRSLLQGASVMEQARRCGWSLVAIDMGIDMSTPSGELLANMLLTTAQFERRLIGERTKAALAVKRDQGVRLGRPPVLDQSIVARIAAERAAGHSLRTIAASLDADQVPTARGAPTWQVSSDQAVLRYSEGAGAAASD